MSTELKPNACPFCGMEMTPPNDPVMQWRHEANPGCPIAFPKGFYIPYDYLERWNRRASPWRPIEECHLVDTEVLLWNGVGRLLGIRLSHGGPWYASDDFRRELHPTHFTTLPEAPEGEK